MRTIVTVSTMVVLLSSAGSAFADAIDDPCQLRELGAPCTNLDGEPGTCVEGELDDFVCDTYDPCDGRQATAPCTKPGTNEEGTCQDDGDGGLACIAGGEPTGTTTSGGTTTGGAGGGGDDGGAGGGTSGGSTEDDGCAVKAPGKKSATRGGAAAIFVAAAALTAARAFRRARRSTDAR